MGCLRISMIPGESAGIVSAPHGHDYYTADVVHDICEKTGLAGLTVHHLEDRSNGHRININRPTEGAGLDPDDEVPTIHAARIYSQYLEAVMTVGRGRLELYVEVHGNETQSHVEVATVGISESTRLSIREALADVPCGALVEGLDIITKDAAANKKQGIIRASQRALHFELPVGTRRNHLSRAMTSAALSRAIMAALSCSKSTASLMDLFGWHRKISSLG